MHKWLLLLVFTGVATLCKRACAAPEFHLNEAALKKIADKGSPQLEQIQASFLAADLQKKQVDELFAPELFGKALYSETNEKPILQFIPIWSPLKQAQVGVRQNLKKGFSAEAAVTTDQRSASAVSGNFKNITTTTLSFTLQMDLWKDLFGRMSEARLESAYLDSKRAGLERDIQSKSFLISLRRIYWSLIANQESIKIAEAGLKISQQLADETRQRFKNSVAEVDEVARNEAQVASKKSILLFYQYQKENHFKQLKNLLPELTESDLVLSPYNLAATLDSVAECTAVIAQESKIPYHFTQYDEATDLIRKVKAQSVLINSRYSDPDFKFYGKVKSTGVGSNQTGSSNFRGSYGSSVDDMQNNNRAGYEVGLSVSIPLGDAKELTQRTKELYDEKRLSSSINANDSQVINTHMQLIKSIQLLNQVMISQKQNTQELTKRLKFMLKKYQQARVSVNDLIQDEDALLRSSLTTVETQLQILNVLFDYFAIYTETPCSFNRI